MRLFDDFDPSTLGGGDGFCSQTADVWQFVGRIVLVLKIVIPVVLIVLGIIGLGKAVIADDDKEIKTQVNRLITKFIAAVVIFFLPNIVTACFNLVNGFNDVKPDYMVCIECIGSPQSKCPVSGGN